MQPNPKFPDPKNQAIVSIAEKSAAAFYNYRNTSLLQRCRLLKTIASLITKEEEILLTTAAKETNLSLPRLKTEFKRTIFQLESYADHCLSGQWLEARIDTPTSEQPEKRDVRKTMVPLGPVVVFGASNFPFAYSTPGGDTASALAAGCSVIVKAHPGHPETSERCAELIKKAVLENGLPEGVFQHVHGSSFEVGEALVKHPLVKAVGFTGSFSGGKQLFDWANQQIGRAHV